MGVLDSHKVNRAIRVLLSDQDVPAAEQQQALATLKQFAGHAITQASRRCQTTDAGRSQTSSCRC
jgi:hypothetical protein